MGFMSCTEIIYSLGVFFFFSCYRNAKKKKKKKTILSLKYIMWRMAVWQSPKKAFTVSGVFVRIH